MEAKRAAAWVYGTSAILGPIIFWLAGNSNSHFLEFIVKYELVPFSAVGLLLAATRRDSRSGRWLELTAAGLWCLTCLAVVLWYPLVNTVDRMGAPLIDAVAAVVGCMAVALIALGAKALGAAWRGGIAGGVRWLLEATALGVLGLYLARMSLQLYASTRVTLSGGIAAVAYEMTLRVAVFGIVAVLLAGSLGFGRYQRRAHGRAAVEQ